MDATVTVARREPWNKGKLVGQRAPLKVKDIWAIRVRLQIHGRTRDLALFDLGIDSKLRGCDLVRLRVRDVCHGDRVSLRAICASAEDATSCSIRDHGNDPRCCRGMDKVGGIAGGRLSLPEPAACVTAPGHPPVRSYRAWLGRRNRSRSRRVRDALDTTHQADVDLPANEEP